ncbi:MAG: hypothetical protein U0869_12610 [Chloroflexota bacterium]
MRLVDAHLTLLKAELAVTGKEIGLIIGLAVAAIALALLIVALLYVGTCLFLGEWLFGSMGWGILHGTLFTIAFIVPIGLNLAGGSLGAWTRGLLVGAVLTVVLSLVFGVNLARNLAVAAGEAVKGSLPLEPAVLPTLAGLAVGALAAAAMFLFVGTRYGSRARLTVAGAVLGALAGLILGSVTFDWAGAIAIALTFGLVTWIAVTLILAVRHGFDPQARYDPLIPRESIAAIGGTKDYLEHHLERQRRRMMGR